MGMEKYSSWSRIIAPWPYLESWIGFFD
ncbi:hypothetical protein LINPERHAP2_LOCUS19221 [Linum perenne]